MRRWSHPRVVAALAGATFVLLVGTFVFPLADRTWASAVVTIVVTGPFVAGALIVAWQRDTIRIATATPLGGPRWGAATLGLMLWGVAPLLLIGRVRLDRGISDFEALVGVLSTLIGAVLVGVATRGQARLLAWAFGLLAVGTVATLALMEPGGRGGEATVILFFVLVPAAAIGLCAGALASLVAARMSR